MEASTGSRSPVAATRRSHPLGQEPLHRPRPAALEIPVPNRHRVRTTHRHGAENDACRVNSRHHGSVLRPHHYGHAMSSDRQSAVIDAEDRHLLRQAQLRPPDPVVLPPAEPPRGHPSGPAATVTLARSLGVTQRRPGAQRLLTWPPAAPEESPALIRQLQGVNVELRNAADTPAKEHRGGDIVVPVEGKWKVPDAATQSCLTRRKRSLQEAHALGQRVIHQKDGTREPRPPAASCSIGRCQRP